MVSFINDSPRVVGDSVEADILLSRPVQSLSCKLKRSQSPAYMEEVDCEYCNICIYMSWDEERRGEKGEGRGSHARFIRITHVKAWLQIAAPT